MSEEDGNNNLKVECLRRRRNTSESSESAMMMVSSSLQVVGTARRRLSNVSDVVSRKISHTIGWRTVTASSEIIVSQGCSLCVQYIKHRLKRSGIFNRKLGLKRLRSAMLLPGGTLVGEIYPELIIIGNELETMYPNLFVRIARQIGCGCFNNEQSVVDAINDISREILRHGEMNWGKVVAIYAVAGGIAVDCVRQGKHEFLLAIEKGMSNVLEEYLASWVQANGGWNNLITRFKSDDRRISKWEIKEFYSYFVIGSFFFFSIVFFGLLKFIVF